MKAVGIVAEYNPFHSGHQYQIRKIRESCGADTPVVAVMSGDFVQRGEAASYDKFTRAEAAVRGGVSLIIELPLPWSLSSAEGFARGGVGLLGATGVVGALSFGSESGNLSAIEKTAAVLDTPEYNEALKAMLAGGTPFAAARAGAARALLGNTAAVLNTPNDLLAVEYLRASAKLGHTLNIFPSAVRDPSMTARAAPPSFARCCAKVRASPGASPGRRGTSFAARTKPGAASFPRKVCERQFSPGFGRERRRISPPCRMRRRDCTFACMRPRAAAFPPRRSPILPDRSGMPTRACAAW